MIVQGSHTFVMFYAHAHMPYGITRPEYPAHYFDDLYPICSVVSVYGSTMYVATL